MFYEPINLVAKIEAIQRAVDKLPSFADVALRCLDFTLMV